METKKSNSIALYILAAVITIGFFALLYILVFVAIPEPNRELLNITVGALIGSFTGGVVGYFFGSSAGSAQKTDLMANKQSENSK